MAHIVLNTVSMMAENIDSLNQTGIYSSAAVDNGTLLTLGAMNVDSTSKKVKDYTFTVALAGANAAAGAELYIAATPEVGRGVNNIYDDPRQFTNEAGAPIDIKRVMVGDMIEITGEAFGTAPTASEVGKFYPTAANGKFGTAAADDTTSAYAYFKCEGLSTMTVGNEAAASFYLRRTK